MGLDCYFVKLCAPGETAPVVEFDEPKPNLIGGMLSGHGEGSFRGKAYADFVEETSGISLYQEFIYPGDLNRIAEAIAEWLSMNPESDYDSEYGTNSNADIKDLHRVILTYASHGFGLHGWW